MKNPLLSIFLFFLSVWTGISQTTIIDYPYIEIEKPNTEHIMINRLELTDSLTVLHCDAYHHPNYWVKLSSGTFLRGESGKMYQLIRCEGFETDKEVFMPQTGTKAFALYFEPLDKAEKSFDLIEDTKNEGNNLLGIKTVRTESDAPIQCLIKGEVIDRPNSSRIKLVKYDEDVRVAGRYIPVKNGKFEYLLNCNNREAYTLNFVDEYSSGSWRPVLFFAENGTISMKLHSSDKFEDNSVEGGELNRELKRFEELRESLFIDERKGLYDEVDKLGEARKLYSVTVDDIYNRLRVAESDTRDSLFRELERLRKSDEDFYSPEGVIIIEKLKKEQEKECEWELEYMKENISLTSYFTLHQRMNRIKENPLGEAPYLELFNNVYKKEYASHPYTSKILHIADALTSIRKGGKYIDFTAPDFEGNPVTLSEQIKGKIALIDLWASWCGPCRRLSESMIPVYEEYKEKDFTVVGVAREQNVEHGINAAKKDGYPWLNLVDLKDENKIWEKYGIGNSGGKTFLVDRDGTILAVHPTADEVRRILDALLK